MSVHEEECECPKVAEREEWIYTYADMVTLLLAFFILLYAMSKTEEEKFKAISDAFRGATTASPFMFSGTPTVLEVIEARLRKSTIAEEVSITIDDKGITVSFNDTALFKPGSAELSKNAKNTIEKFARILYHVPNSVVVEGHTDNTPINTPLFPSNWELSGARAGAVARELEIHNIDKERIEIAAYADTRPRVSNTQPNLRKYNRRINILIKPNDDGP